MRISFTISSTKILVRRIIGNPYEKMPRGDNPKVVIMNYRRKATLRPSVRKWLKRNCIGKWSFYRVDRVYPQSPGPNQKRMIVSHWELKFNRPSDAALFKFHHGC